MPKTTNHCQEWACGIPRIWRGIPQISRDIPQIQLSIPQIWLGIPLARTFHKCCAAFRKYGAAFHNFCATSRKFGKAFHRCIMRHSTTWRGIPHIQRVSQQIRHGILQLCRDFHKFSRGILNLARHSTNTRRLKSTLLDVMNLVL